MFCPSCGVENPDAARFCKNCGGQFPAPPVSQPTMPAMPPPLGPPPPQYSAPPPPAPPPIAGPPPAPPVGPSTGPSGMAITALVLGILSLCCFGIFSGIPAAIIGFIENNKIKRGESSRSGSWMAIVGIVLGILSVVTTLLAILWIFFWGGMAIFNQSSGY